MNPVMLRKLNTMLGGQQQALTDGGYTLDEATGDYSNPALGKPTGGVWKTLGSVQGNDAGHMAEPGGLTSYEDNPNVPGGPLTTLDPKTGMGLPGYNTNDPYAEKFARVQKAVRGVTGSK